MPTDDFAAALTSAALASPSLPREPSDSSFAIEDARLRATSEAVSYTHLADKYRNVVNDGKCIGDRMGLSTADRFMIHVPMFHCFGMTLSMTSSMTHGATLCPMPYFSAKASLHCITPVSYTHL